MIFFEHLVQVDDPLREPATLTRAQLWQGLVRRAVDPTAFVLGLKSATIRARRRSGDGEELDRTLDFGTFTVDDTVRLEPPHRSRTRIAASARFAASTLNITIEEPHPGALFLRFVYEFAGAPDAAPDDPMADELRRQAYRSADHDTMEQIRALARRGALG